MSVIKLTNNNFKKEVIDCKQIVLVDFSTSWCEQCKILAPILEEISEEKKEIKITKVDVEEESILADQNYIMTIPTILVFKNGKLLETSIGLKSKEEIINLIEKNR